MARTYRSDTQAASALLREFPNLARSEWSIKSWADDNYQCIAWAECRTDRKSWPAPGYTWPEGLPLADPDVTATVDHFIPRFALLGYMPCGLDKSFQLGYQKVAIYANDVGVTHMARQRFFGGGWFSKPGEMEDIFHPNLEDIEGETSATARKYGKVVLVLKRSWWKALVNLDVFRCSWEHLKSWTSRRISGHEFR